MFSLRQIWAGYWPCHLIVELLRSLSELALVDIHYELCGVVFMADSIFRGNLMVLVFRLVFPGCALVRLSGLPPELWCHGSLEGRWHGESSSLWLWVPFNTALTFGRSREYPPYFWSHFHGRLLNLTFLQWTVDLLTPSPLFFCLTHISLLVDIFLFNWIAMISPSLPQVRAQTSP